MSCLFWGGCTHVCYACMYVCTYVCMVCMVCMVCIYVSMYACMYVFVSRRNQELQYLSLVWFWGLCIYTNIHTYMYAQYICTPTFSPQVQQNYSVHMNKFVNPCVSYSARTLQLRHGCISSLAYIHVLERKKMDAKFTICRQISCVFLRKYSLVWIYWSPSMLPSLVFVRL